jgi:hypothetical protein
MKALHSTSIDAKVKGRLFVSSYAVSIIGITPCNVNYRCETCPLPGLPSSREAGGRSIELSSPHILRFFVANAAHTHTHKLIQSLVVRVRHILSSILLCLLACMRLHHFTRPMSEQVSSSHVLCPSKFPPLLASVHAASSLHTSYVRASFFVARPMSEQVSSSAC